MLAVLTFGGRLSLIKGFDDVHPCYAGAGDEDAGCDAADAGHEHQRAPLLSPMMEWNNDGELLCLAGHYCSSSGASSSGAASGAPPPHYVNVLQFYNSRGVLRFRTSVPYTQVRRLLYDPHPTKRPFIDCVALFFTKRFHCQRTL